MTRLPARRLVRRLRSPRGANLVEAALVTPLLLLLTFAIADFGCLFYAWLALENGVSQATRYSITGNLYPGLTREESIRQAMRDATPTLTLDDADFTFTHLPVGGTTWTGGVGGANDIGKVTVNYSWTLMTPLIRPFFTDGKINLRVESAMKNEGRFE